MRAKSAGPPQLWTGSRLPPPLEALDREVRRGFRGNPMRQQETKSRQDTLRIRRSQMRWIARPLATMAAAAFMATAAYAETTEINFGIISTESTQNLKQYW